MKKTFQIMCCFTLLFPDMKRKRWKTSEEKKIPFLTLHTGLDLPKDVFHLQASHPSLSRGMEEKTGRKRLVLARLLKPIMD